MSELIQAVILLCHFHSFSAFVLGCGLLQGEKLTESSDQQQTPSQQEIGVNDEDDAIQEAKEVTEDCEDFQEQVTSIMKKMESLRSKQEELEMAELARRFETIEIQEEVEDKGVEDEGDVFTTDKAFKYVDFIRRENPANYPTLKITVIAFTF